MKATSLAALAALTVTLAAAPARADDEALVRVLAEQAPVHTGPGFSYRVVYVASRGDVLSWQSDVLEHDVVIAGQIDANLFASTTGSDADWIVKLIDVYPDNDARMNMRAGMAWALTLVNMRHPEIVEAVLRDQMAATGEDRDAFVNGIMSAVVMRCDTSPDDPPLEAFIRHRPIGDAALAARWDSDVRIPCEQARDEIHPVLRDAGAIEEVFRYQSLTGLVDRLRRAH